MKIIEYNFKLLYFQSLKVDLCVTQKTFRFTVDNLSKTITAAGLRLELFDLQGLKWFLEIRNLNLNGMGTKDSTSLGVFLFCDHTNGSLWSCDVQASFKLIPINANDPPIEKKLNRGAFRKFYPPLNRNYGVKFSFHNENRSKDKYISNDKITVEFTIAANTPKYAFWNRINPVITVPVITVSPEKTFFIDACLQIFFYCKYLNERSTAVNNFSRTMLVDFSKYFNDHLEQIMSFCKSFESSTELFRNDLPQFVNSFFKTIKENQKDPKLVNTFEAFRVSYLSTGTGPLIILDKTDFYEITIIEDNGKKNNFDYIN